jgi:hypothetical protein
MEKNSDPGSGMNIPDNFSESLETVFWARNTSGSGIVLTWDPGQKHSDLG